MNVTFVLDPGKSGGYAVCHEGLGAITLHNLEGLSELLDHVAEYKSEHREAVIEEVPCYCGKDIPGSSTFKLGYSCGMLEGAFRGLEIPVHFVGPKMWQKGLSGLTGFTGAPRKRVLKEHAHRLYPILKPTLKTADALLIAHHFFTNR